MACLCYIVSGVALSPSNPGERQKTVASKKKERKKLFNSLNGECQDLQMK